MSSASGAGAVERLARDQAVVEDDVGGGDQLERARGQQPGIAGARADEVDGPRRHLASPGASSVAGARRRACARPRSRPERLGVVALARRSRTHAEPSGSPTNAARARRRRPRRARRPACGSSRRARRTSARSARRRPCDGVVIERRSASRVGSSSARASSASAPWPAAGTKLVERRGAVVAARPSRSSPAARQHDRVALALGELAQPRVDVAAQLDDLEVRARRAQLGRRAAATRCRRARPRPASSSDGAPHEHVARVRALGDARRSRARPPARPARPWPSAPRRRPRRRSSARSSSATQRDLSPPGAPRSPAVDDLDQLRRRRARRPPSRACASASALPRVPMPQRHRARAGAARAPRRRLVGLRRLGRRRRRSSSPNSSRSQLHARVGAPVARSLQPQRRLVQQPVARPRAPSPRRARGRARTATPSCRRSRPAPARRCRRRARAARRPSAAPRASRASRRSAGSPPR